MHAADASDDAMVMVWKVIYQARGRPPMIVEGWGHGQGAKQGKLIALSAWHGRFSRTDLHGSWQIRGYTMELIFRYCTPSRMLTHSIFKHDGKNWKSENLKPPVVLVDPVPAIEELILTAEDTEDTGEGNAESSD
jgi:hypothetical protein